jgi:hypothetical protein
MGLISRIEASVIPYWYEIRFRLFRRGWWWRLLAALVALIAGVPQIVRLFGPIAGAVVGIAWVTVGAIRMWNEFDPGHIQLVQGHYLARKLGFFPLISKAQNWQSHSAAREVTAFQESALQLIAMYTRDHRTDLKGTQIFANLMVPHGNDLVVVARDLTTRPVPQRYGMGDNLLCWAAFRDNETKYTGDVYRDFPKTPPGKPYRSILAVPVRDAGGNAMGVVSIDSSRRYHFDLAVEELKFYLLPYIALFEWTVPLSIQRLQNLPTSGP